MMERHRNAVLRATLLGVRGRVQREGLVIHVIGARLVDLSSQLQELSQLDGAFERAVAQGPTRSGAPIPDRGGWFRRRGTSGDGREPCWMCRCLIKFSEIWRE
ncbi:MAG TPA: hypothetical protein VFO41_15180 [Alphaproteobacteria bacterium]|nr:hypothetical protein [Alphaproteobacteria bacterium]